MVADYPRQRIGSIVALPVGSVAVGYIAALPIALPFPRWQSGACWGATPPIGRTL